MSASQPPQPFRIYFFANPRTASNLFCKLFSEHPDINQWRYPFLRAHLYGPDRQTQMTGKNVDELRNYFQKVAPSYQTALDKVQILISESEKQGKTPFLKDQCSVITRSDEAQKMLKMHRDAAKDPDMADNMLDIPEDQRSVISNYLTESTNPTIFPDRFLETLAPVFIIRHPVKQIESWYKASRLFGLPIDHPDFELHTSYKFSRRIFDYFKKLYRADEKSDVSNCGQSKWPIVIDGEEVVNDAESIAKKFCQVTGIDPSGVIYKWEPQEPVEPGAELFYGNIMRSNGVIKNLNPKQISMAESSKKWEKEWGEDMAKRLVQHAEEMLVDYEYLYQFKL